MKGDLELDFRIESSTLQLQKSYLDNSREEIFWLPIIQLSSPDYYLGITEDGTWCVERKLGLLKLEQPHSFLSAKVLLEQPIASIRQTVQGLFGSIGIDAEIDKLFLFYNIVKAVFEDNSDYWIDLAFKWYEEFGTERKMDLKESLNKIVNTKSLSQKLRQKAALELRNLS